MTVDLSTLEEYANPALYDLEVPDAGERVPLLQALAEDGDSALDLGCGTGRYTLPLARAGVTMTGLDITPPMLAHAKTKAEAAGLSIEWVEADVRSFQLNQRFPLIFDAGEAFVHVLDRAGHEQILARVREHLAENGRFVLMVTFLRPAKMVDNMEENEWFSYTDHLGREVRVSGTDRFDHLNQVYHEDAVRRWRENSGEEVVRYAPLARRYFFPQELEMLLHYNGFAVVSRHGDWDGNPLTPASDVMIFVCKLHSRENPNPSV